MKRIKSDKKAIFVPIVVLIVLIIASIVLSQICKSSDVYKSLVQVAIFSLVCLVTLIMASTADSPKKKQAWLSMNFGKP